MNNEDNKQRKKDLKKDLKRLLDEKHDLICELALKSSVKKKFYFKNDSDKILNCLLTDEGHVVVFLTRQAEEEFYSGDYFKKYRETHTGVHIQESDIVVFHRNFIQKKIEKGFLVIE